MGGAEAVAKWHAKGRMTARERIAAFVDDGSFHELGMLTGKGRYTADGHLIGFTLHRLCVRAKAGGGLLRLDRFGLYLG